MLVILGMTACTKESPQPEAEVFCWECIQDNISYETSTNAYVDTFTTEFLILHRTEADKESYIERLSDTEIIGDITVRKKISCDKINCD